jgi:hypothetical protein
VTEARNQTSEIRIRTHRDSVLMSGFRLLSGRSPDGAIAQLGERLLCKQEVVGSIPSGSTNLLFALPRFALLERVLDALPLRCFKREASAALAKRVEFTRAACRLAHIFYIVKRGLTWDFLVAARTIVLVQEAAT